MKTRNTRKRKQLIVQPETDLQQNHSSRSLHSKYPILSQQQIQQSNSKLSQTLSTHYQPKQIKCRQLQKQQISKFVKQCLSNQAQNNARVLYISGVPGVGKTLSTMRVIKQIRKNIHHKKASFKYINAMQLKTPHWIYRSINTELFKVQTNDLGRKNAPIALYNKLKADSRIKFLIIDQIDFLITKDQQILYNLFEWSNNPQTKICLIIIANTMDFPEKLMEKIISRMGQARLVFKPYTQHQVQLILEQRISKSNRFTKDALIYACKKMSTYTSDIRKLLHVLRSCLDKEKQIIQIEDVVRQWRKITTENNQQWQQMIPDYYRAILNAIKETGGRCFLFQVYDRIKNKHQTSNGEIIQTCKILNDLGILKMQEKKYHNQISYEFTLLKL